MMSAYFLNASKSKSLAAQIRDAERQVMNRQRRAGIRAATLVQKIRQQMTAPATLLLASGIGFIMGELTKRQIPKFCGTADTPDSTGTTTPLRTALNFITSARTLYTALLPLAWMMKSFRQTGASSEPVPERQCNPVAAASGATTEGQGDSDGS